MSKIWLDWFVLTKKAALMQRLADLVRTGHRYYVTGQITIDRAGYLAGKLEALYQVGISRLEQSRKRKNGWASFRLFMFHQVDHDYVTWWLLRSDGKIPPDAMREKWRDAHDDRIELTGYELVRQVRAGASAPAWTWRYTRMREQDLRHSILRTIRSRRDDELRQLIQTIWRTPGFAAARDQVKKMKALILADWKRSRSGEPLPDIPSRLGYVRRIPDVGRKLSVLGHSKVMEDRGKTSACSVGKSMAPAKE